MQWLPQKSLTSSACQLRTYIYPWFRYTRAKKFPPKPQGTKREEVWFPKPTSEAITEIREKPRKQITSVYHRDSMAVLSWNTESRAMTSHQSRCLVENGVRGTVLKRKKHNCSKQ